jgi:hypothetical protein
LGQGQPFDPIFWPVSRIRFHFIGRKIIIFEKRKKKKKRETGHKFKADNH